MLYEMSGRRRTGVDLSALHVQMKYAPVMELVDMRDLGAVTSVTDYLSGYSDHPQLPLMDKKS